MSRRYCITKVFLESPLFFPPLVITEYWAVFRVFSPIIIYAIERVWCTQNLQIPMTSLVSKQSGGVCLATSILGIKRMHGRRATTVCYVTVLQPNISGFHTFQPWPRHIRWASQSDSMRGKAMTSSCWTCQMFPDTTKCFPTYE